MLTYDLRGKRSIFLCAMGGIAVEYQECTQVNSACLYTVAHK